MTAGDHETPVPDLKGKKLTIVIPLPEEIRNRAPYFVYKVHGGTVSAVDNTYQEEHQTLTIRADEFSTYAIAYTQETEETAGAVQAEHDSGTVREGRWMQNDTGWWYAYSNGTLTAKATITVVANNATKKQLPTDTIVQYGRIESYTEIDKEIKADST